MAHIAELSIDLIGHTAFTPPADIPWTTDAGDGSALVEFAGRACYETWDKPNPHTATNAAYVRHIMDVGHTAVLEHSTASMYLRGVSRSCGAEIMRHRHFSFSQLSQRFVPHEEARVVVPEDIKHDPHLVELFLGAADVAYEAYKELLDGLSVASEQKQQKQLYLKQARQAARSVLPHCTETRFVMSGNFRTWRHFIAMRATEHADPEIRRIAVECLRKLRDVAPEIFNDFSIIPLRDGGEMATSPYVGA